MTVVPQPVLLLRRLVFLSCSDANALAVLDVTKTEPFSGLTAIEAHSVSITCMTYTDNEEIGYLENIWREHSEEI